jgi:2-(1,2-epoxy-1,2-dihydrophenyl)acetyl-CoA isomerase
MTYETLTRERHGGAIEVITLNRPDAANGLNPLMARELADAAAGCDHDPSVKVVVLTATGRFFSAGGDVKAMAGFGDRTAAGIKSLADDLHRAVSTFARMAAPLVVAVNGVAAGAGFSLALLGDLVLAGDTAAFTMAYTSVGLSPDGSSSYFLPRLIGLRRAQELMLTNRKLSAAEALDWGLVTRVVPDADLMAETLALATTLARGSSDSNAAIKRLLLETFTNPLETQMELEGRTIAGCAGSANGREGIAAFVEKRRPDYV